VAERSPLFHASSLQPSIGGDQVSSGPRICSPTIRGATSSPGTQGSSPGRQKKEDETARDRDNRDAPDSFDRALLTPNIAKNARVDALAGEYEEHFSTRASALAPARRAWATNYHLNLTNVHDYQRMRCERRWFP
jgi:hypothetical protein